MNVTENEVWRRNKDAGKQDVTAGGVPESDGWGAYGTGNL